MLVGPESPLRTIPESVEARTVLFLDGVRYSVEFAEVSYETLRVELGAVPSLKGGTPEFSRAVSVGFINAWAFVDACQRLRTLIQQVPGMKQNSPEIQSFIRSTRELEEMRNYVQHFRSEIDGAVGRNLPLWGVLTWSEDSPTLAKYTTHMLVPGTFFPNVQAAGCVFDLVEQRFTQRLVLRAGGYWVEISKLFQRISSLFSWVELWCRDNLSAGPHHGSDVYFGLTIRPLPMFAIVSDVKAQQSKVEMPAFGELEVGSASFQTLTIGNAVLPLFTNRDKASQFVTQEATDREIVLATLHSTAQIRDFIEGRIRDSGIEKVAVDPEPQATDVAAVSTADFISALGIGG